VVVRRRCVCVVAVELSEVTTLAGRVVGTGGGFFGDGTGSNAGFMYPFGVAVDASGNVFVGDQDNHRIRKVSAGGGTRFGSVTPHACVADIYVVVLA
jgi:hypothetical protein